MNRPSFLVTVEFPHEWTNEYHLVFATETEAEDFANDTAHGKPGDRDYRKVAIYELIKAVN